MKTHDSDIESPSSEPTPRKPRKKWGILDSLSTAQQEQLVDWLELHPIKTVLELVAAPPPEGFGIKTHITSLRRFQLRAQAHNQKDLADCHLELLEELGGDPQALSRLTDSALRQFAVELATVNNRNPANFATVSSWVLRLQQNAQRDRELKSTEDRIALEREKFQFNAARAAILHMAKMKEILTDHPGDSEDKIWACRDELFGPRSDLIENPNLETTKSPKGNSYQPRTAGFQPAAAAKNPNAPINQQAQ
jgi:hypothetical protein